MNVKFSSQRRGWRQPSGFTLVELLIVITIIGILISLIMPAMQNAQEAGRRAQCLNNVHQMATGCMLLESKYGYLPGGGWGWCWAGDPDLGYGAKQPGGWIYNILPFIDQTDLRELGKNNPSQKMALGLQVSQTPLAMLICPTRRKIQDYPRQHPTAFININDPMPRLIGRSDYAANSGSLFYNVNPGNPNTSYTPNFDWTQWTGTIRSTSEPSTGVIFRASELPTSAITDGCEYTYLLGERDLAPDNYYNGSSCDNDQGWDMGYDYDINRGTGSPPAQDRMGYNAGGCNLFFGSAHASGFHMAMCDGSAKKVSYSIDPTLHSQLGARGDGQPTQLQQLYGVVSGY